MKQRQKLINQAKSWLGCKESDGSFKEIIDVYNQAARALGLYIMSYNDPWCAAFVTACAWKCNMTNIIAPSASCDAMIAWYKKRGEWKERGYFPQTGDIIFYDWDSNGTSDHVGIVTEINGAVMKIIEGNCSDSVAYRHISTSYTFIKGYGVPSYGDKNEDDKKPQIQIESATEINKPCKVGLPMLRIGDGMKSREQYKSYVKSLQILLIGNKFSCGGYGADGEFGSATDIAVRNFQKYHNLMVDGIVGNDTWQKLIGG